MTKWVKTRSNNHTREYYHTDKDCQVLKKEPIKATENLLNWRELKECKVCAGRQNQSKYPDKTCPMCGKTVKQLAGHLPCND